MADIFISYAKADRPLALKLAAMLEVEGWKTWWDTSLTIGDDFRNEIMTELGRARAVIVIWTDASIKSDWVRSEAGRAQADRKLIPVKLDHLTYKDLPPPFDVLHTENVGEENKIKAAVVAQLAKPAVEPSPWALLGKGFKYELLTWVGIVGGALTLFTNLGSVLKLADWARWVVQHWKEWTYEFWVWAFGWLGIHLPPEWTPVLSFLLFGSVLAIGQAVKFHSTIKDGTLLDKYQRKSFQLVSWRTFFCLVCIAIGQIGWVYGLLLFFGQDKIELPDDDWISHFAFSLIQFGPLVALVTIFGNNRLNAALATLLIILFWMIIIERQLSYQYEGVQFANDIGFFTTLLLPVILLSVAPAKAISRRLIFLALGLLLLIGLNELSKLGLDLTAPKVQG